MDVENTATCSACSPDTYIKNFMSMLKVFLANRKFHFRFLNVIHTAPCSYNQHIYYVIQHMTYLTATCLNTEMSSSGSYYSKGIKVHTGRLACTPLL